ncbi:MAG: GHMP kinase [Bacteroidota bacterium]
MKDKHSFFDEEQKVFYAKSPARLDVMGGIADYSGSLVLQMPLALHTEVYIAKRTDSVIRIYSKGKEFLFDISHLPKAGGSFLEQRVWEKQEAPKWSLYVLGCLFVLLDEKKLPIKGLDIWITSEIPIGAGISSSAALEVATMRALYQIYDLPIEREPLAALAQKAENFVVGAPCGIMDQLAVHLGQKDALLPIICQPYSLQKPIPIPENLQFFNFNTEVKHSVSGNTYSKVRTAAFMGMSIILQHLGVSQEHIKNHQSKTHSSLPYNAYLANISTVEFEQKYAHLLPKTMAGRVFKQQFGATIDALSTVEEKENYSIYACTKHPIYENERVHQFSQTIQIQPIDFQKLGELMFASHQGYVDCGLSCKEADFVVQQVRETADLYGARITGGGSGGTVCILGRTKATIVEVKASFDQHF